MMVFLDKYFLKPDHTHTYKVYGEWGIGSKTKHLELSIGLALHNRMSVLLKNIHWPSIKEEYKFI